MLFCFALSLFAGANFSVNAQEENSTSKDQNLGQNDPPNENKVCQTCESKSWQNASVSADSVRSGATIGTRGGGNTVEQQ
jgi:hypothetical protein